MVVMTMMVMMIMMTVMTMMMVMVINNLPANITHCACDPKRCWTTEGNARMTWSDFDTIVSLRLESILSLECSS